MYLNEEIQNKWKPVLEHPDLVEIKDAHKRAVTAQILENTEKALREAAFQAPGSQRLFEANNPTNAMGGSSSVAGDGIDLEGNISKWWATQNYKVAHGEGLFKHNDLKKHGMR